MKSDITIIGAGPAGTTAAIALAKKGIPSLLLDKHHFPRPKICGDGLSGKAVSTLNRLDPAYAAELNLSTFATGSHAVRFYSPALKMMELSFRADNQHTPSGFVCKRKDFDHYLFQKIREYPVIQFEGGIQVNRIVRNNGKILLEDKTGSMIAETSLVLFAAGNDRKLIRQLDPSYPDREEGIGVRGYFTHVTGSDQQHAIEIHFLKELLPWYLWIFPFSDGSANVGLALPESLARNNRLSLKELLLHLIEKYPYLKDRFSGAKLDGKIEAARLPYFTGPCKIAGDNYLLLGDAARIIDPFTGEGIGNAMLSGILAAENAEECMSGQDYSFNCTNKYQGKIYNKLGAELALGLRLQGLARRKFLLNLVIGRASGNEKTRNRISEMLYSNSTKTKLKNPLFYLKLLLGIE